MTVKQLIKILETMPQEAVIQINYMSLSYELKDGYMPVALAGDIEKCYSQSGIVYLSDFNSDND